MEFTKIAMVEAEARFQVSEHLYGAPGFPFMLLVEGDVHLEELSLHEFPDDDVYGYIVDGNLTVAGSITSEDEEVMALLVTGDVHAGDVFAGGADTAILGNLRCDRFVIGLYNSGYLHITGDLHAPYVITSDHDIVWGGAIEGATIDVGGNDGRYELRRAHLRAELLEGGVDVEQLVEWLRAGRSIVPD